MPWLLNTLFGKNEKRHMNSMLIVRMRGDTQIVHTCTARMRRETQTVHTMHDENKKRHTNSTHTMHDENEKTHKQYIYI